MREHVRRLLCTQKAQVSCPAAAAPAAAYARLPLNGQLPTAALTVPDI